MLSTYKETIDYLFEQLPLFSRTGAAAYKADLLNTVTLCNSLNNPQSKFKSIHIAGTNGKGSVSHMLAAIFQQVGYKTGLYTSPHLKDFRERIKINGEMIAEEFVVSFTQKIKPQIEKIAPSFFEITVAMAFDYFAEQKVDIAIIETGLGGRLDSTNIITPELSVITNIGLDHTAILGDTVEKIAVEKAGIIKPNVPVVIGEAENEVKKIFVEIAEQRLAPISFAQEKRKVTAWKIADHLLHLNVTEIAKDVDKEYSLDLPGIYQLKNTLTVLQAMDIINQQGWNISDEIVKTALSQVKKLTGLHGRWELIHTHPSVVLDVAHNPEGMRQIIEQLKHSAYQNLYFIMGMVKDKDVDATLALLPKDATYYFTQADIPRALSKNELAQKATILGLKGEIVDDVNMGIATALKKAQKNDLIIVCGSVFLIGEVNDFLFQNRVQ